MADVTKIKLPDNSTVNIRDARIPGVDTTPTSGSSNLVTSGGVYKEIEDASKVTSAALNNLDGRVSSLEQDTSDALDEIDSLWDAVEFDDVPTANSENAVKSGGVYSVIIENELATTTALNDLNQRLDAAVEDASNTTFATSTALNDLNDRVLDVEEQLEDFVSLEDYESDEETIAQSLNDLNDRVNNVYTKSEVNTLVAGASDSNAINQVNIGNTQYTPTSGVVSLPAYPDAVTANPTVPSGTTPTALTGLKVGSGYYSISSGGNGESGGISEKTYAIPFGSVDSTSTSTVFTATVNSFPATLSDGVCAYIYNGVVSSASGCTLNINNTGAKPIYSTMELATAVTTTFNINYTMLFIYNSTRVSGGCWDMFYGYYSTTQYRMRTNSTSKPVSDATYRYRLLFSSADDTQWVPANSSTSTNATASRTVNQTPINPFGPIVYYGTTTSLSAEGNPSTAYQYQQYNITLGYSFNRTGAALTLTNRSPVYIKCAPQADGSAIIDADTPYVQTLPSTEDGKIYIYLGQATSATAVELVMYHPVYYYKNGSIRPWTNPLSSSGTVNDSTITIQMNGSTVDSFTTNASSNKTIDLGTVITSHQTLPTISTNVATDKADNTKIAGAKATYDEVHPAVVSSQPAGGFAPNVLYELGTITGTVTFTMASPSDATIINHYYWTFETSSTAPTITWPSGITSWYGGSAPIIIASKHYEVSVLDGVGCIMEV